MSVGSIDWYTANVFERETTIASATTISIPFRHSKLIITNDDPTLSLMVELQTGNSALTLKPMESLTILHRTTEIKLSAQTSSIPYRLWAFG